MPRKPGSRSSLPTTEKARARLAEFYPDQPLWHRQDGESEAAYAAFIALRDSPLPRPSLPKLRESLADKRAATTLYQWAARWCWGARLTAWDSHIAAPVTDAIVATHVVGAADVARQASEHAQRLHKLARLELDKLIEDAEGIKGPTLTPKTLMDLIRLALQIDHVLVGGDAEDATPKKALDLGSLDIQDIRALKHIANKVGGNATDT